MARENFELAILISLKDAASRGTDRVTASLREMGREGRTALKQIENLKDGLKQDLALSGIGIAGLAALRGGTKAAGDFESVMTDLSLAFSEVSREGVVNLNKLAAQMAEIQHLTIGLGNDLPGTTGDFAEMMTVLKQGGLEAQTIINGAGKSVAHLSVVTRQVPKDLAKDFAQFGQQFKLKPEEYTQAADLFARIYARSGLGSAELIEGSKYFQLRAGAPLGLVGFQGAETAARLMAAMKKLGLEGSIAGTGTATFFKEIADVKKLERLTKETGIKLNFFDGKGQFLGIDNAFKEMEKLRTLSTQARMNALDKLVGSEGAAVGTSISEMGLQGWRDFNAELDKAVSLQESIKQKTADYNAKVESLSGTLENLKVTAFTPMLDVFKPMADGANKVAGSIQEFSKAHPVLTRTIGLMFAVGSGSMVVVGGFNAMTTAWRLWRLVAAVGAGEAGLLTFLKATEVQAYATNTALQSTALQSSLSQILGKPVVVAPAAAAVGPSLAARIGTALGRVGLIGAAIGVWTAVIQSELANSENEQAAAEAGERLSTMLAEKFNQKLQGEISGKVKSEVDKAKGEIDKAFAPQIAEEIVKVQGLETSGNDFLEFWKPKQTPFVVRLEYLSNQRQFNQDSNLGRQYREQLKNQLYASGISNPQDLDQYLRKALEVFNQQGRPELYAVLEQLARDTFPQFQNELDKLRAVGPASEGASRGLVQFGLRLNNFQLPSEFSFNRPFTLGSGNQQGQPFNFSGFKRIQSNAIGGRVESDGMVHVHRDEDIIPARVARGQFNRSNNEGGTVNGGVHFHIHPPAGSAMAENPKAFAKYAQQNITHQVRKQREKR